MTAARACVVFLIATVVAIAFRAPHLERRPMHTDEAVHAFKFGELLEEGYYQYDPHEFHGPTLNYFTLASAKISGIGQYADLRESTVRMVPVVFGLLLVLLLPLLGEGGLGRPAAGSAALLTAISPAFVFYSRYYIQEILLVCFTFGLLIAGHHYWRRPSLPWAAAGGLCLGLMYATKETWIIAVAALAGAAVVTWVWLRLKPHPEPPPSFRPTRWHLLAFFLVAGVVSSLFFSSFLSHPRGVLDAVLTYQVYLDRAGQGTVHVHPWHYYLGLLAWYQWASGPVYSEWLILILALVGIGASLTGRIPPGAHPGLPKFLACYTLLMLAAYSLIPYKTPWCLLGFYHGMVLMAGVGVAALLQLRGRGMKHLVLALVGLGAAHLGWQAWSQNFRTESDSRNPYVYAHTSRDIFPMVEKIHEAAAAYPEGTRMPIHIVCPGADYWPFPWYLRNYPSAAFYAQFPMDIPAAPVILIQPRPEIEADLVKKLYEIPPPGQREMYLFLFYHQGTVQYRELRPQVEIQGYVAKSLWDRMQAGDAPAVAIETPSTPSP